MNFSESHSDDSDQISDEKQWWKYKISLPDFRAKTPLCCIKKINVKKMIITILNGTLFWLWLQQQNFINDSRKKERIIKGRDDEEFKHKPIE